MLMGSGPIVPETEQLDPMTLLWEHPFTHTWHLEVIVIDSLSELVDNILSVRNMQ